MLKRQRGLGAIGLVAAVALAGPSWGQPSKVPSARLERFADAWLDDVSPIATAAERRAFAGLESVAEQELFIRRFWDVRSAEQSRRFADNLRAARELRSRSLDRQQVAILAGSPRTARRLEGCDLLRPIEIWELDARESGPDEGPVALFYRESAFDPRTARLWEPGDASVLLFGGRDAGGVRTTAELLDRLAGERCLGGPALTALRRTVDRAASWPQLRSYYAWDSGDPDWLKLFASRTSPARLPRDVSVALEPVGRSSRSTIVRGIVRLDPEQVEQPVPGQILDEIVVEGDVRRGRRLVDSFRIVHRLAGSLPPRGSLALDFHRRLFPGTYTLALRVADRSGVALLREDRELTVPKMETEAPPPPGRQRGYGSLTRDDVIQLTTFPSIEILPPPPRLLGQQIEVRAAASGAAVRAVAFAVDGEPRTTIERPPFRLDLDLDRPREVTAEALDRHGNVLAVHRRRFEPGPVAFSVALDVEARRDGSVPVLLTLPAGRELATLRCFHNDRLVARVDRAGSASCPWPAAGPGLVYLRAEARLDNGEAVEDLAFVGEAPESIEVSLAEVFVSVSDGAGRPVEGLDRSDLDVRVGGTPTRVQRFGAVGALPLALSVMLDTSSSMSRAVGVAADRTRNFFERFLREQDKASLLAFNHDVRVLSSFADERGALRRAPVGLRAWGSTRLFDAVAFGLHGFVGASGRRALIVVSDGTDTESDLGLEEVARLARRAGVMIYPVYLARGATASPTELSGLAEATGGRFFRAAGTADLDRVFREIEQILRLQYSLVIEADEADLHRLDVSAGPGRSVRVQGYTP